MTIEQITKKMPVGAKVKYFPLLINKSVFTEHEVRSEPWTLGHGEIVIKVSNKSGGVSIDHLELI